MSRIRGQSVSETNHRLVASAMRRFSKCGVANTKIDEICADAEVSRKTLYEYYDGKYALFDSILNSEAGFFLDKLESVDKSLSPDQVLRDLFYLIFDEFASGFGFLMSEIAFNDQISIPKRAKQASKICMDIVDTVIRSGIESGKFHKNTDPKNYVATMNILINGFYSSARAVEQLTDIELRGNNSSSIWRESLASTLIFSILRRDVASDP